MTYVSNTSVSRVPRRPSVIPAKAGIQTLRVMSILLRLRAFLIAVSDARRPSVIPAQAGNQTLRAMPIPLGSGLRRNDTISRHNVSKS